MRTRTLGSERTPWARLTAIGIGLSLVVGVILLAFTWPGMTAEPHDLPVGIVGAEEQVARVAEAVDAQSDGAIALTDVEDRASAIREIEERDLYGAIVLGASPTDAPELLTATAASPQVAQLLNGLAGELQDQVDAQIRSSVEDGVAQAQEQAAAQMQAAIQAVMRGEQPQLPDSATESAAFEIPTVTVQVTDVVPFSDDDPNGTGLTASMFPLVIGGIVGGVVIALTVTGPGVRRLGAIAVYSAAAGLVLTGILQGWYGALQGDYWVNSLAMGLAVAAIASTLTGLSALLGQAGLGLGAALMMLVANPLSAATMPVEFLASPWGQLGQWLPPGAAGTLIRSLSYFPDADTTFPWLLLAVWAAIGIALTAVARRAPAARRSEEPR